MSYAEFLKRFIEIKAETPTYRLGQFFASTFEVDEANLWQLDGDEAIEAITLLMFRYQWDFRDLPVKRVL